MSPKNLSGKRIRLARTSKAMAQIEVCAALSVEHGIEMTQNTLSNIERGARIVRDVELAVFANLFDVNPIWLLFGDKAPCFRDTPLSGE